KLDSAIEASERLLGDPRLDDAGRRSATLSYARALHWQGRGAEARRVLRGSVPDAPRSSQDELILVFWALSAMDTGHDLRELEAWALSAVSHAAEHGSSPVAAVASNAVGRIRSLEGRFTEARRWLAESSAHHARRNPYGTLVRVRAAQVYVGYMLDDPTHAVEQFRDDIDVATTHPTMRAYALRGMAWAALAEGDPPAAQRIALDAAQDPRTRPYAAAELTHDALRAGAPAREIAPRLARLRTRTDSPLAAAYAEHADALVARSGSALLAVVDVFADIGALRLACECAADAARFFADEGRADSARRAAAQADKLHLGGRRPHLGDIDGPSIELTRREAQLVDLASRGLSNAEIADRLVLSTRTVESHLYNAMKKLGVTDRRDL
ncbi:MAG TPA: helix-turn-helix transcriptional regulator, partial [Thermoleophilia bacterium]|nr:helix-turn-helix transcriptional regulator [Thermoleophilia bacterium]